MMMIFKIVMKNKIINCIVKKTPKTSSNQCREFFPSFIESEKLECNSNPPKYKYKTKTEHNQTQKKGINVI